MNCRPGDLAVFVRSSAGNEGRIVRVVRFVGYVDGLIGEDRWLLDSAVPTVSVVTGRPRPPQPYARDSHLRPIRDNDGEDEMLRIAGHPLKHLAQDVAELHKQVDRLAEIARDLVRP